MTAKIGLNLSVCSFLRLLAVKTFKLINILEKFSGFHGWCLAR